MVVDHEVPADWDESEARRRRAAEAEEIIANEQPGKVIEEEADQGLPQSELPKRSDPIEKAGAPQGVVSRFRRRRS